MTTDHQQPDDPRVRALVKARRDLLAPIAVPWDQLTPADQETATRDAELWLTAAIRAGIAPEVSA